MISLQNEHISLREAKNFDSKVLEKLADDKLIEKLFFVNETKENYFEFMEKWNKHSKNRDYYGFVIEENSTIKGFLSLIKEDELFINYFIGKKYRNNGLAYKAINLIIPFAFYELREKYIYAKILQENTASTNLLKKLNFDLKKEDSKFKIYFLQNHLR